MRKSKYLPRYEGRTSTGQTDFIHAAENTENLHQTQNFFRAQQMAGWRKFDALFRHAVLASEWRDETNELAENSAYLKLQRSVNDIRK